MITVEKLGRFKSIDNEWHDAYVVWFSDPNQGIAQQMPVTFECEVCQLWIDLSRYKTQGVLQSPAVRQTSISCSGCGAAYHFDITPEADRASLTWIHAFSPAS